MKKNATKRAKVELRSQRELERMLGAEDVRSDAVAGGTGATGFAVWSSSGFAVWSSSGFAVW